MKIYILIREQKYDIDFDFSIILASKKKEYLEKLKEAYKKDDLEKENNYNIYSVELID